MRTAYLVLTGLAAAIATFSAIAKLRRDPKVVRVIHDVVGVPMKYLPLLAACELAGAAGIILGLWWPALGVAAGVSLVVYFVAAVASHLRVGDVSGVGPALFVLGLVSAALAARVLTL